MAPLVRSLRARGFCLWRGLGNERCQADISEADEEGNQQHCLRNSRRLGFPSGDYHPSLEIQVNKMGNPPLAVTESRVPAPDDSLGSFWVVTWEPGAPPA